MVLGTSPEQNTNYSSNNLPDFVVMEQSYLDNYTLDYNVNRVASSSYEPSQASINIGEKNPSYNLKEEQAFVWNNIHSEELKSRWSVSRGKYTLYIYSAKTYELIQILPSAVKFSGYLKVSLTFGLQIVKLIQGSELGAVIYKDFIVSLTPHSAEYLSTNLNLFTEKFSVLRKGYRSIILYGFNPSNNEYRTWLSKGDCLEDISGERFTNMRTINKRIDKGILYNGFYIQTKPFK